MLTPSNSLYSLVVYLLLPFFVPWLFIYKCSVCFAAFILSVLLLLLAIACFISICISFSLQSTTPLAITALRSSKIKAPLLVNAAKYNDTDKFGRVKSTSETTLTTIIFELEKYKVNTFPFNIHAYPKYSIGLLLVDFISQ